MTRYIMPKGWEAAPWGFLLVLNHRLALGANMVLSVLHFQLPLPAHSEVVEAGWARIVARMPDGSLVTYKPKRPT